MRHNRDYRTVHHLGLTHPPQYEMVRDVAIPEPPSECVPAYFGSIDDCVAYARKLGVGRYLVNLLHVHRGAAVHDAAWGHVNVNADGSVGVIKNEVPR
jgi:sugar phosphate isomerase/epimerase